MDFHHLDPGKDDLDLGLGLDSGHGLGEVSWVGRLLGRNFRVGGGTCAAGRNQPGLELGLGFGFGFDCGVGWIGG